MRPLDRIHILNMTLYCPLVAMGLVALTALGTPEFVIAATIAFSWFPAWAVVNILWYRPLAAWCHGKLAPRAIGWAPIAA